MKKIVILTGPMAGHGGEETVISTFVNLLSDKYIFDLCISLCVGDTSWVSKDSNYFSSVRINNHNNPFLKLRFLFKVLFHTTAKVIICLTPRMIFLARIAQKLFFKKYKIISWPQFTIAEKFDDKTAKMLKKSDYHLAISSGIYNELISLGLQKENIGLIYNPIAPKNKTIFPSKKTTKFIYIARIQLNGQKNLGELLKALALLDRTKSWEMDIYGADDSEGEKETYECKNIINALGLSDRINWCGYDENLWGHIDSADCLVLSSKYEGFGMVLCEAISYGIPVISSDCPVGPKDIVNENNGYLYPMGDVHELAKYLSKFINNKTNFDPAKIKGSIQKMYFNNYKNTIEKFLNEWEV